jgi:hypothetical protein
MDRPAKPRPDFPLFAHANGQWAKKIQGKLHYFGPWENPQAAEDSHCRQKAELEGDRRPKHGQSKRRRQKPEKPRPDFPLYPHPSGQWACKFGRQTKYFGPWNDPDGAEQAYQSHITNQCTKVARGGKVVKNSDAPRKPRKNFPLWPHPSGQWAKKINGTTYYFTSGVGAILTLPRRNTSESAMTSRPGGYRGIASPADALFKRRARNSLRRNGVVWRLERSVSGRLTIMSGRVRRLPAP